MRFAHAGVSFAWGDQGGEGMPLVYGSSATIYFDAEFDYEFLYLFSSDARKHRVDIEKAGVLFWTGYIEPDSWSEPLITTPYPVECTAYDGLGFLKDATYVPSGRKTIETILDEILVSTGLILSVNINLDWYESGMGSNVFSASIDTTVFDEMSCYEVLEQLFKGCRIFQRAGQWWIISNTKLATLAATVSGFWFEGGAKMQILPAVKQMLVIQDFGYNENLLLNGNFQVFNEASGELQSWSPSGVTPQQRILDDDGSKYVYLPGRQKPASPVLQTHYITNSLAVKQTASVLKVGMKYALMGTEGVSSFMYIRAKLWGNSGSTYFLVRQLTGNTDGKLNLVWIASNSTTTDRYQLISPSSHAEFHFNGNPALSEYVAKSDLVPAFPASKITDHFETFSETVVGIPEDGLLQIYMYVPYTADTRILGSCFTGVTLELLEDSDEHYPTEKTHTIVNSQLNNYAPDDLKLVVGDYPAIINTKLIYKGGFRRTNDDPTTAWGVTGSGGTYTFAEFIGRMLVSSQRLPRQNYQARLADVIPSVIIILSDPNNPGKLFVENGISYDDRFQAVDGQFAEILSTNMALTVDASTSYALPPKVEFINPNLRPNLEERVTLIDKLGAKVSFPGYMYANDFEKKIIAEEADDDGFTRIQVKNRGITPYALDFDSGTPQFSLRGAMVECNVDGNANKIRISAGQLISHHFNARDRDDIELIKAML